MQFWSSATLLIRVLYLLFQVAVCNQLTIVLRHWKRYRPSNHIAPSMNCWFQCCELHSALVKCQRPAEEFNKNLADTFHCRHVTSDKKLVFLKNIFSALIDNPNNFEINRLIMLVVSGMFLLPCSAPLMCFSSF